MPVGCLFFCIQGCFAIQHLRPDLNFHCPSRVVIPVLVKTTSFVSPFEFVYHQQISFSSCLEGSGAPTSSISETFPCLRYQHRG